MKAKNRKEIFLKALANGEEPNIKPLTREEILLKKQAERESESTGGDCDWNIMKNKPTEMVGSDTLTWDGSTEGKLTTQDPGGLFSYVKISNATPTSEDFANGGEIDIFFVPQNTVVETKPLDETTIVVTEAGININNTTIVVVTEPDDVFTEKGTWAMAGATICSRITINGYTGFNPQEKIKKEYLPESAGGGGVFVVNVSREADGTYTCDKTRQEIYDAFNDGAVCLAKCGDSITYLTNHNTSVLLFETVTAMMGSPMLFTIAINADYKAEVTMKKLTIAE